MAAFSEIILTQRGQNLLAKAQAGTTLNFTRMAVGNGELNGQSIAALNNLINQVKSLPISTLKNSGNSTTVGTTWNNEDITSGFYFREIGIFATDPQLGEILYAYGNAGALAEYIPPLNTNLIERTTQIKLYVLNVSNVTAVIDTSLLYATTSELQTLEEKVNVHLGDMAHIKVSKSDPIDLENGNLWFELGKSSQSGGGESGLILQNAILSDGAPGDTSAIWMDYDEEELMRYGK